MKTQTSKAGLGLAITMGLALAVPVAHAQLAPPVDAIDNVNLIGLAVGSVPDYSGSSHNKTAVGPIVRYQFTGTDRYFLWLGPTMYLNLINDKAWRAGPMLNYRAKRDDGVDDEVVKRMTPIDDKIEGGVFLQYNLKLSQEKMHQIVFAGDIAAATTGRSGTCA